MTPADLSLLWICSHFFHPSGHAEEARAILRALEQAGYVVASRPARRKRTRGTGSRALSDFNHPRRVALDRELESMLVRQLNREPREPYLAVHHYVPRPSRGPLPGVANVARAMFETDRLPTGWRGLLAGFDEVWVPSAHNHGVFAAAGVPASKLRVIGGTLDFDAFDPGVEPYPLDVPPDHLVFLSSFDFSERKGWRQLLTAWASAFDREDDVCLVLKTGSVARWDPAAVRERISDFLRAIGRGPNGVAPVRIITRMLPAPDVPRVYAAADAFVSASRGEAWGRPYMEAMAMGLPTIGTRFGGNIDFMSDTNSWLVGGRLVPVDPNAELINDLYRGHRWFEADVEELAAAMREVAEDPARARRKAAPAREELRRRFGPDVIARQIGESAAALLARQPLSTRSANGASSSTSRRKALKVAGAGASAPSRAAR